MATDSSDRLTQHPREMEPHAISCVIRKPAVCAGAYGYGIVTCSLFWLLTQSAWPLAGQPARESAASLAPREQFLLAKKHGKYSDAKRIAEEQITHLANDVASSRVWWQTQLVVVEATRGDVNHALEFANDACSDPGAADAIRYCIEVVTDLVGDIGEQQRLERLIVRADALAARQAPDDRLVALSLPLYAAYGRGMLALSRDQVKEALAAFEAGKKWADAYLELLGSQRPDDSNATVILETQLNLAELNKELLRLPAAEQLFQAALQFAKDSKNSTLMAEALLAISDFYEFTGDEVETRKYREMGAHFQVDDPEDVDLLLSIDLLNAELSDAGADMDSSRAWLNKAQALLSEDKGPAGAMLALYEGQLEAREQKDEQAIDRAEEAFTRCLNIEKPYLSAPLGSWPDCVIGLADVRLGQGHPKEALAIVDEALKRLPVGSTRWGAVAMERAEVLTQLQRAGDASEQLKMVAERIGARFGAAHPDACKASLQLAERLYTTQDFEGVEALLRRCIDESRRVFGPDSLNIVEPLRDRAGIRFQQAKNAKALEDYHEVLRILQANYGEYSAQLIDTLKTILQIYDGQGDGPNIEKTLMRIVEVTGRGLPPGSEYRVDALSALGMYYTVMGRRTEAEYYFALARKMVEREFHSSSAAALRVAMDMAQSAMWAHDNSRALELTNQLLILAKEAKDTQSTVSALMMLASVQFRLHRPDLQERELEEAWQIAKQELGLKHAVSRAAAAALMGTYEAKKESQKADELDAEAGLGDLEVTDFEPHSADEHGGIEAVLADYEAILQIHAARGNVEECEKWARKSYELARQHYGELSPSTYPYLSNYENYLAAADDIKGASELAAKALTGVEGFIGKDCQLATQWREILGGLLAMLGEKEAAERYLRSAVNDLEKGGSSTRSSLGPALYALGQFFFMQNRFSEAEPYFVRAYDIEREVFGAKNRMTLQAASQLILTYFSEKKMSSAAQLLDSIKGKIPANDIVGAEFLKLGQMFLDASNGKWAAAKQSAHEMQDGLDRNEREALAQGSESYKFRVSANWKLSTDLWINLFLAEPSQPEDAYRVVLRHKALVQEALMTQWAGFLGKAGEKWRALAIELQRVTQEVTELDLSPYRDMQELQRKRALKSDLENKLSEVVSSAFLNVPLAEPVQVADVLSPESALAEFFKFLKGEEPHYAFFWIRPGAPVQAYDLGRAKDIDELCSDLHEALSSPGNGANAERLGGSLYQSLFRFIDPGVSRTQSESRKPGPMSAVRHLYISPDGWLNSIPFEVLRDASGLHLVERFSISYIGTGRDLIALQKRQDSREVPTAVSAPDFGATGRRKGTPSTGECPGEFSPLRNSATEADAFGKAFPGALVLEGTNAGASSISDLKGPRVLHLSTHGFVCSALPPGNPGANDTSGELARSSNALHRAGIALAGANLANTASSHKTGWLSAADIARIDLHGTQLAVLSACETGLGALADGEGVMGLRRAFAIAGARAQLFSLWQISDRATADLMASYYAALSAGKGHAGSLRETQLQMLRNHEDPYVWASFVAYGDPGPLGK